MRNVLHLLFSIAVMPSCYNTIYLPANIANKPDCSSLVHFQLPLLVYSGDIGWYGYSLALTDSIIVSSFGSLLSMGRRRRRSLPPVSYYISYVDNNIAIFKLKLFPNFSAILVLRTAWRRSDDVKRPEICKMRYFHWSLRQGCR